MSVFSFEIKILLPPSGFNLLKIAIASNKVDFPVPFSPKNVTAGWNARFEKF